MNGYYVTRLQKLVFPEGIYYNKRTGRPRTEKMNALFALSARGAGLTEEKENGSSEVIFKNSGLVDRSSLSSNFLVVDLESVIDFELIT